MLLICSLLFSLCACFSFSRSSELVPVRDREKGYETPASGTLTPETEQTSSVPDEETLLAEREAACKTVLNRLSLEDKLAQLLMPSFRTWNGGDLTVINDAVAGMLSKHAFAGVVLFANNTHSAPAACRLTDAMQRASSVGDRPQLLIAVDQEGGSITRLGTGTQMPGNMALGAAGDPAVSFECARVIGTELSAIGINVDFAPVMDINTEPGNPVIGIRSFSDDPTLAASVGAGYVKGLKDAGVIATLKHYPGHGDTLTDSHTGLPSSNVTYEELMNGPLVPFAAGIEAGAGLVMTSHIRFPNIDTEPCYADVSGEEIIPPATLSKKMITDVLRGQMGYQGVVVTDAMIMDAVTDHFSRIRAAKLAINAGVDLLLMPVDTSSDWGLEQLDAYLTALVSAVENGEILSETVDAAVMRVLRLKYDYGLLSPYQSGDIDALAETAEKTVGSAAHHEIEWGIACKAVTLVRNEADLLPYKEKDKKIVVVCASPNERLSVQYAVDRLKSEGKLPQDTDVRITSYSDRSASEMEGDLYGASLMIVFSELYSAQGLSGYTAAKIDEMIAFIHEEGGKAVVLSCHLPYDAARFRTADAIMLTYSDKGMDEDPRNAASGVASYGPNIPAAVYMALNPSAQFSGSVPVDIPLLDENFNYMKETLYSCGFGIH